MGSSSILQDVAEGRAIVHPWTVVLYHHAIDEGWLEERAAFELLDGFIVRKDRAKAGEDLVTVGDRHRLAVQRLVKLAARFEPLGHTLQVQQPIQLPPMSEPEPDGSVIRGIDDDYRNGPPGAAGVPVELTQPCGARMSFTRRPSQPALRRIHRQRRKSPSVAEARATATEEPSAVAL